MVLYAKKGEYPNLSLSIPTWIFFPDQSKYQMLEKTLASSDEQWKIVLHHHPVYVSSGYYNLIDQKAITGDPNTAQLRSLYETYGVDLVSTGIFTIMNVPCLFIRDKLIEKKG